MCLSKIYMVDVAKRPYFVTPIGAADKFVYFLVVDGIDDHVLSTNKASIELGPKLQVEATLPMLIKTTSSTILQKKNERNRMKFRPPPSQSSIPTYGNGVPYASMD